MLRTGLAALMLSACCAAQNPVAGDRTAVENGRNVFRIYCSPCHGIRGEGGRGPDLTRGTFSAGDTDADLFRTISEGVGGTEMQAYGKTFGDDGVWRVVAYIRSIARGGGGVAKGDPASGEKLFWGKGGCGACHAVAARGGFIGPDLTRAGRQRSIAYLRESILTPSNDLTPGYFAVTVATRDGRTITGVERGYDNFSAQMVDTSGRFYSFQRAEVASMKREYRSIMPAYRFGEAELEDLLAYLVSLRGGEASK